MLYNPLKTFEDKVYSLPIHAFFSESWSRNGQKHYTEELGITEGETYTMDNHTLIILKRLVKASDVRIRVFGSTVYYDETIDKRTFEYEKWINIDSLYSPDGEYPFEHVGGLNDDNENVYMALDDIAYFTILPTQKPTNVKRYKPCL